MAVNKTVIVITDKELRLLRGQWPDFSLGVCQERSKGRELAADIQQLVSGIEQNDRECILIIPRREYVLSRLDLPSAETDELLRMVALQIPRMLPFEESQVIYNYRLIQTKDSGYSDVLAAAVLKNTVQSYIDAASKAGLVVSDVYISFDLQSVYAERFFIPQTDQSGTAAVVVSDDKFSEVLMVSDGQLIFSYHLPFGKADMSLDTNILASALKQIISDYEKTGSGNRVSCLYLDEQIPDGENIKNHFADRSGFRVEIIDLFEHLPDPVRAFVKQQKMTAGWIPALGYFCQQEGSEVKSFLPQHFHLSKAMRYRQKMVLRFLLALVAVGFLTAGIFQAILYRFNARLTQINKQIAALEPDLKMRESESKFLNMITGYRRRENSVVYQAKEIFTVLPEGVFLQDFQIEAGGRIELRGIAVEDRDVGMLQSALVSSSVFKNVNLQYATKRRRFDKEYVEFKFLLETAG